MSRLEKKKTLLFHPFLLSRLLVSEKRGEEKKKKKKRAVFVGAGGKKNSCRAVSTFRVNWPARVIQIDTAAAFENRLVAHLGARKRSARWELLTTERQEGRKKESVLF